MSLQADLLVLLPELILAVGAMALLLAGAISDGASRNQTRGGEKPAPAISWGAIFAGVIVVSEARSTCPKGCRQDA